MNKPHPIEESHWLEEVRAAIHDQTNLIRATIIFRKSASALPCLKAIMRPVSIRKKNLLQISMFEGKKDISHNYTWQDGHMQFEKLLAPPFHSFYVHTALTDLQGRCTRKGKLLLPKSAPTFTQGEGRLALKHQKSQPIDDQLPNPFVQIIGLDDTEGNLIPQMRPKFRQVNQLLRILEKAIPQYEGRIVHILDCGSGSAWPTFSAYHYLHNNLQMPVQLKGIDCYEEVNEKSKRIRIQLG